MNTTAKAGPLTQKTFKELPQENEKIGLLNNQMVDLKNDYEDMKRNREEAKNQLEAKFQDVHRKIQNTRDFVSSEGLRINNTLRAFQSKFESQLNQLNQQLQAQHDNFSIQTNDRLNKCDLSISDLNKRLAEEKEDRLRQSDENLREIRRQLTQLFDLYETEKNTRVEREKEILQKLSDESFQLNEKLDNEKTERILKSKELKDHTDHSLFKQQKFTQDFNTKTIDEFNHVASNLEKEMDQRFAQQNQIVDNISNVIKTIQDTLRIIGKGT